MTDRQRLENDIETMNRRETEDKTIKDDRARNDEITKARRFQADKTMDECRLRNDEITANRREMEDGSLQHIAASIRMAENSGDGFLILSRSRWMREPKLSVWRF